MSTYTVRTVLMDGSSPATAASAIPETIRRTLNEPDQAALSWPKHAYPASALPVLGGPSASIPSGAAEVQIYRDTTLAFWGPIISVDASGDEGAVSADLAGVDWYLLRRFIDGVRPNRITNPSFESGTTDWTNGGSLDTFTTTTSRKLLGTNSLRMVATNDPATNGEFAEQMFTETGTAIGTLLTGVAWFYIESATVGPAGSSGFVFIGYDTGTFDLRAGDFYPIDLATPQDQWVRTEITIWVPPNEAWDIYVRLYCPGTGEILWDAVQVVAMDSVGTDGVEQDVEVIFDEIIPHLQNASPYGKSNVNIGFSNDTTGITALKQYQFADHVQFDEALREFLDRDDVGDYRIDYAAVANGTSGTRTFHLYDGRYGTDLSGSVTLTYPGNIANYRLQIDGASVVTRATVLGEGDGPDREEGEYADASAVGGLILQDVQSSPPGTEINSLQPLAQEIVRARGAPIKILDVDLVPDPDLIGTLDVGDTVALAITDGYVTLTGDYRIVAWELDCRRDVLTLTLNEEL